MSYDAHLLLNMSYLSIIKTAIFVFPIFSFLFTIPFILHQYHQYGSVNKLRVLIIYSFILYLMTTYFLVILPLPDKNEMQNIITCPIQLVPFSFVVDICKEVNFSIIDPSTYLSALCHPSVYTMLLNIVMTIPFGMYLRYYFKYDFKKTVIMTFILSLFFELTQLSGLYGIYSSPYRICDVDDLITNTLGGAIGYWLISVIDNYLPTRDDIDREAREKGRVVSGLRRITLFWLDSLMSLLIFILMNCIVQGHILLFVILIVYYAVIPYFDNGKTIGGRFLNVRIEYTNRPFLRSLLRIVFIYIYYIMIPYFMISLGQMIVVLFHLSANYLILLFLCLILIIITYYLVNLVVLLKNGHIFYDKCLQLNYVSTIDEKET